MNNLLIQRKGHRILTLAIIYSPVLALFAFTLFASTYAALPIGFFFSDPTATLKGHPLTGMLSNIGVLVWCASAVVCLFSSSILWYTMKDKTLPAFLLCLGLITSVLMLDDLFIFHDDLAYNYLGLNEIAIIISYGVAVAVFIAKFREIILGTEYALMLTAAVFFALSVTIDFFQDEWESPLRIFYEDGFKILGIVSWAGYSIQTCFRYLLMILYRNQE